MDKVDVCPYCQGTHPHVGPTGCPPIKWPPPVKPVVTGPRVLFVTRIYQVVIPEDRTAILETVTEGFHPEDAAIVAASDEAIAVHLSYQYDIGNFHDQVDILDTTVSDLQPDVQELVLNEDPNGPPLRKKET